MLGDESILIMPEYQHKIIFCLTIIVTDQVQSIINRKLPYSATFLQKVFEKFPKNITYTSHHITLLYFNFTLSFSS